VRVDFRSVAGRDSRDVADDGRLPRGGFSGLEAGTSGSYGLHIAGALRSPRICGIHGGARRRVRLELGTLAYNLLCEEYPLAERDVKPLGRGRWSLDTEVAGMAGVGRFVVGLLDDIRIVDSPELTGYIREYIAANTPKM